jgi:hypothetical protein
METAMSDEIRPSDQEIDIISRMCRETADFFSGLAMALGPQESRTLSDKSLQATAVEQS